MEKVEDIVIVGGGIAGLTTSLGRDGAILWAMAHPPPKKKFWKKKGSIYITYRFEQFCPYKIRLAPLNKIFDPFKQNEKAQETFTNLKSQTKQISKPKKISPTT